jgi:hypothetical protein
MERPFDIRWCYYSEVPPLWNRARPNLNRQCWSGNHFIISRFNCQTNPEGCCLIVGCGLFDKQTISRNPGGIPFFLRTQKEGDTADLRFSVTDTGRKANLAPAARAYLASLGLPDPDADQATAELIWYHALAIGYSPFYLAENADGIRQDWPRIPLPQAKDALLASASLGRQVAALLDTEAPVPGVTVGQIRDDLKGIAVFQRVDGKPANPEERDLDLTAGWGHAGKGGVTMPGKGKLIRRDDGACDIFLNDIAC